MNERGGKKYKKLLGRHFVYMNARGGKKYVKSLSRPVFLHERAWEKKKTLSRDVLSMNLRRAKKRNH